MTVAELGARMSSAELTGWIAHDLLSAAEREHAAKLAESRARGR